MKKNKLKLILHKLKKKIKLIFLYLKKNKKYKNIKSKKMKYILISLLILFPVTLSDLSHKCSDKELLDSDGQLKYSLSSDVTKAFNEVASCISLEPNDRNTEICCYMKIKFENELLDEKFTHKGCHSVPTSYLLEDADPDIEDYIDGLEDKEFFYASDTDETYYIDYKSISIDCNSKYLAIGFGLLLLFL